MLKPGTYTLPGNVSSQFVSGLMFALPLLSGDSEIHVTGVLESRPYADMTLNALRLFGITIVEEKQVFRIPGRSAIPLFRKNHVKWNDKKEQSVNYS
jgi:3-phosphoshikimate 1-carboxyvinyltransferase